MHVYIERKPGYRLLLCCLFVFFFMERRLKCAAVIPFGRCHCRARLRRRCLCFLLTVFAGLAGGRRKKQSEPALCWKREGKAAGREGKHQRKHKAMKREICNNSCWNTVYLVCILSCIGIKMTNCLHGPGEPGEEYCQNVVAVKHKQRHAIL